MIKPHRTLNIIYFVLLFLCLAPGAFAWDSPGHMLVADIAWAQLAAFPLIRAAIAKILRGAKSNFAPSSNSDDDTRDAFDFAATFPDVLKRNRHTAYEAMVIEMNANFWPDHQVDPATGNEKDRCKTWHYFDTPIRFTGPKPKIWPSNLLVAYPQAVEWLKQLKQGNYHGPQFPNITVDDLKFWNLAFILHLAGDAQQPLHCVSDYKFVQGGDAGGNKFSINSGELHGLWDAMLVSAATGDGFDIGSVAQANGSTAAILAQVSENWLGQNPTIPFQDLDVKAWVAAGADAALNIAYKDINPGDTPTNAYLTKAKIYAKSAGIAGGSRLAAALVSIFS